MKVTLREKKIQNGKRSLYLDYYPPIINGDTNKPTRREFLSLYIYEKPKLETERNHNKETRILAQNICAKRQIEIQESAHGFISRGKRGGSFLALFAGIVQEKKLMAHSTFIVWDNACKHFSDFCGGACSFSQIDRAFVENFKHYLLTCQSRKSATAKLSPNTIKSLFEKFVSVVKTAYRQKFLLDDPTLEVKRVKGIEPKREFLTLEELQKLAVTNCESVPEDLRRAALFSALTGLRHSDIAKLIWREIEQTGSGNFLNLKIQKTGEQFILPVSDETLELLGIRGEPNAKVFPALKYSAMTAIHLNRWLIAAGIAKNATFHAFRRTFTTNQIAAGTDFYTVSKMLGHANVKQTQVYANLLDKKKMEAAGKIKLK